MPHAPLTGFALEEAVSARHESHSGRTTEQIDKDIDIARNELRVKHPARDVIVKAGKKVCFGGLGF